MKEIFDMPLFPHLYAIPLSVLLGVFIGFFVRAKIDDEEKKPRKPQV